jgi:hypothetical protein
MKAKILVYVLPVFILATIHLAEAQQAKVPKIGWLGALSLASDAGRELLGREERRPVKHRNLLGERKETTRGLIILIARLTARNHNRIF